MIFAVAFLLVGGLQSLRGPFYGLMFYLSIAYFRPETWVWSDTLQGMNISLIVGLYTLAAVVLFRERLTLGLPSWAIALFCVHAFMSTMLSMHYEWCFFWWREFAKICLISILIIGLVNTKERLKITLLVITFALGLEGAKQGWAYVVLRPDEANANPLEILGDNNGVAVGMLMLSAVILSLLQTSKKKLHKGLFGFLVLGTVFRALTTFSRGGLLSFAAMFGMYWYRSKRRLVTGVIVLTLGAGLLALLPQSYWTRMSTINAEGDERDASAAGRLYFWEVARRMAADNPVFGVGTIGFQRAYNQYDSSGGAYGVNRAVHSTWFGVLADQGYVGFIGFILILLGAFRALGRARKRVRGNAEHEDLFAYAGAMQSALVTLAVGGTFISYHYVEVTWHFIALSFAVSTIANNITAQLPVSELEPASSYDEAATAVA